MQASLNQLAEILAERAGRQFDIPFREEMKVVINYWRSRLIVDSLNSRPKDRKFFTKWVNVPLEKVSISDFPGFPECEVLRTKCALPDPVRANSKLFDFVGKLDRMTPITIYEPYFIKALSESRYSANIPRGARIDGHIYVFGTLNLPGLAINMIPDDVEEFKGCCQACGDDCYDDDKVYPVSGDLQQRIIQAALATELRVPAISTTQAQEVVISNGQ